MLRNRPYREITKKLIKIQEETIKISPEAPRILKLLSDENVSIKEIASAIERDITLSARILRLANSPFYGIPRRIGSIKDALIILGISTVRILVVSVCIVSALKNEIIGLQKHSARVAFFARSLAELCKLMFPSEVFIAGLLHDFGKIAMERIFGEEYIKFLQETHSQRNQEEEQREDQMLKNLVLEEEKFGITHAFAGAYLLDQWYLPERIVEAVRYHHIPEKAEKYKYEAYMVHIADRIDYFFTSYDFQKENSHRFGNYDLVEGGTLVKRSKMLEFFKNNTSLFLEAGISLSSFKNAVDEIIFEDSLAEKFIHEIAI